MPRRQPRAFTLVELLVVLAIIALVIALALPAIQTSREASRRTTCQDNLRQLSLAVLNFEGVAGHLPPSTEVIDANADQNNGAWGVHGRILPFLEEGELYQQVDIDIAWDHQAVIDDLRIPVFACPSDENASRVRTFPDHRPSLWPTTYGFNMGTWFVYDPATGEGGDGLFYPDSNLPRDRVTDGTGKTLLVAEVKAWTAYTRNGGPASTTIPADAAAAAQIVRSGAMFKETGHTEWPDGRVHHTGFTATLAPNTFVPLESEGETLDADFNSWQEGKDAAQGRPTYAVITSRSHHPGGVYTARLDGSVHFVSSKIDLFTWRSLATRSGGAGVLDAGASL